VLLELVRKGMDRDKAYRLVQKNAMRAWDSGEDFQKLLLEDKEVKTLLSDGDITSCFDAGYHLRHVDYIYNRVFGDSREGNNCV
jgi:adenylosuccinate lyase